MVIAVIMITLLVAGCWLLDQQISEIVFVAHPSTLAIYYLHL
jgi:hypothetical protein